MSGKGASDEALDFEINGGKLVYHANRRHANLVDALEAALAHAP